LVGVDQAKAAVLTYNFQIKNGVGDGFFKVDNSSLTGIGYEEVAVSEGIFNTNSLIPGGYFLEADISYLQTLNFDNNAVFYQGDFLGLEGYRSESGRYKGSTAFVSLSFDVYQTNAGMWTSSFSGYSQINDPDVYYGGFQYPLINRVDDAKVSYTLVDIEPEPVPEPLTAGGTALALAGLSWLKHKKKMAA
jgi:hypothetical protein